VDRVDKLAVSAHLRLFCLTKWLVSYKGPEMLWESLELSAGFFTRFVGNRILDRSPSIGRR
jgi:hypothetical protein